MSIEVIGPAGRIMIREEDLKTYIARGYAPTNRASDAAHEEPALLEETEEEEEAASKRERLD